MIATLVQIAKEMACYEAKHIRHTTEVEKVILNRLCKSPVKKDAPKVAIWDVTNKRVQIEDYKDEERYKYLYALSTGKHAIGPSWLIAPKKGKRKKGKSRDELIQTALREIQSALTGLVKSLEDPDEQKHVKICCKSLREQSEQVVKELKEKTDDRSSVLLTIAYEGKLPGEMTGLQKAFVHKRVIGERRAESKGKGHCAICGKEATVQSAIPLPFFTVEKRGFSPMGREEMVWKYAPICYECAKWLCVAQSYLQENLSTRVVGKYAYLIPDLEPSAVEIEGPFIHYLWEWHKRTRGRIVPDEDFPEQEEMSEGTLPNLFEGLLEDYDKQFKDKPPFRSASLVFYQPGQKFIFLYTISDILPRNLQKVSHCLRKLREFLNQGVLGDDAKALSKRLKADLEFVGQVWRWVRIGGTGSQGVLKLSPMHLAEAILTDKCPSEHIFWSDVDKLLKTTYLEWVNSKQQQPLHKVLAEQVGLIWAIWTLIYRKEVIAVMTQPVISSEKATLQNLSSEFWEALFQPMLVLDSESKKAVFLIGVLFGEVERLQRRERESKAGEMPIVNRLRGLTISGEEITDRLLPELMLKIRQLGGNTEAALSIQQAAAYYATRGNRLSDEVARYCFCLGWALSRMIIQKVRGALKPEKEEEGEKALE
jgi:hypothetical protein